MSERIKELREREPGNSGRASYQAILEASAGLFSQFPVDTITIRDIITTSGASNQTLYNYFPSGRDDVAIVLYDRIQRAQLEDFKNLVGAKPAGLLADPHETTKLISACLARAFFGQLRQHGSLYRNIHAYLDQFSLISLATFSEELERSCGMEMANRYGVMYSEERLPRNAKMAVNLAREMAEQATRHPASAWEELESLTRKLLRVMLASGLNTLHEASGEHALLAPVPPSRSVVGAPLSTLKRLGIIERILKRRKKA